MQMVKYFILIHVVCLQDVIPTGVTFLSFRFILKAESVAAVVFLIEP